MIKRMLYNNTMSINKNFSFYIRLKMNPLKPSPNTTYSTSLNYQIQINKNNSDASSSPNNSQLSTSNNSMSLSNSNNQKYTKNNNPIVNNIHLDNKQLDILACLYKYPSWFNSNMHDNHL